MSEDLLFKAQGAMRMYYKKYEELERAKRLIEQLEQQLAAEKALADRLYKAIDSAYVDYAEDENEFCAALEAYRKARGL